MSALTWQAAPAATETQPAPQWDQSASPSSVTQYLIYDCGGGSFLATVQETKGPMYLNNVIAQSAASLTDAQNACQADWDLGVRK